MPMTYSIRLIVETRPPNDLRGHKEEALARMHSSSEDDNILSMVHNQDKTLPVMHQYPRGNR